ncbi:Tat pathway signal protein [Brevundimonas sp.]|uniref:Tat pathway signal protein n=1 Tax=Brevundimonas sp. TaxID=1871086 RepID=UPI0025FD6604|nr:Tat pathway signal protein [Brevundimonas sp.]
MRRRDALALTLAIAAAPTVARAGGPSSSSSSQPSYTRFPTLTATIVRSAGRRGVLSVEAGIDVHDEALRSQAAQAQPRLRAALTESLREFGAGLLPGHAPDADRLARELQAAVDRTLGRSGARVLLGTILVS